VSGGLRRRDILDLQGLPLPCFLSSFFLLSSFHCVFLTEARFPPEARWFSRNSGCQDVTVLPQIWVWGSFWFLLLFLRCIVTVFLCVHWRFSGRVCSVVVASVFATTISSFGARHFHRCNLPDHIPSSLRSSCSFFRFILADPLSSSHSRRPSLCITTFSPYRRGESEWITRSHSPKHRRGESDCIMD
jgi:hypothetical protein